MKIQEQFKDGMKHGDKVSFFCKNKEKKCSYTEETQCIDGTLEIPKCFKGKIPMGLFTWNFLLALTITSVYTIDWLLEAKFI